MSLAMLLGQETADAMRSAWPEKPSVHQLPDDSPLRRAITAQTLNGFITTGCVPGQHANVFHHSAAVHPGRFVIDGQLSPAAGKQLLEDGCTIQLREINRWYPPLAATVAAIQRDTGYPCYATGFVTPPGEQGLEYHWDQYLGIVVQLAGSKTWELWEPKVEAPHRDHSMSTTLWQKDWVAEWKAAGPDMTVELAADQVLVLPRGWVHNPHSQGATETSVHVTFVLKERSPLWVAERLVAAAINEVEFRDVISPGELDPESMVELVKRVQSMTIGWLARMPIDQLAKAIRFAAEQESSYATL